MIDLVDVPEVAAVDSHTSKGPDPRQAVLIASLRARYAIADQRQDADAKRALFKEAAYLGIRPDAYQAPSSAA